MAARPALRRSFAGAYMGEHPRTIDVPGVQADAFGHAEPTLIGGDQRRPGAIEAVHAGRGAPQTPDPTQLTLTPSTTYRVDVACRETGRPEKQHLLPVTDEAATGELLDDLGVDRRLDLPVEARQAFSIVACSSIVLVAALFAAAIVFRRDTDTQRRLMIVANASILQAAVARVFLHFLAPPEVRALPLGTAPPPPIHVTINPAIVVDLLIVVGMVYDARTRGRPQAAYVTGLAVLLAVQFLRLPPNTAAAWQSVLDTALARAR